VIGGSEINFCFQAMPAFKRGQAVEQHCAKRVGAKNLEGVAHDGVSDCF
jgi:hypothetical protein